MYLKKVLNQPNLVGTVMIVLLFGAGFVYAFAFDGFNVETVTGGEVEAWIAQAGDDNSGDPVYTCDSDACKGNSNPAHQYSECPSRSSKGKATKENCTGCSKVTDYCKSGCPHGHSKCKTQKGCPQANKMYGGCSNGKNKETNKTQTTCPSGCK